MLDAIRCLLTAAEVTAREDVDLMRVNALGPMWITQALLPEMQKQVRPEVLFSCTCAIQQQPHFMTSCAVLKQEGRSVTIFVGSVGGASQSVFPGMFAISMCAPARCRITVASACPHCVLCVVDLRVQSQDFAQQMP